MTSEGGFAPLFGGYAGGAATRADLRARQLIL
jgi:hypothetical protein